MGRWSGGTESEAPARPPGEKLWLLWDLMASCSSCARPSPQACCRTPLPPLIRAYSSINKHTLAHLARAPNSREFHYLVAVWWQKFAREQGKKGLIYFTGSLGAVLKTTWGGDRTGQGDQGKGRCSKAGRR